MLDSSFVLVKSISGQLSTKVFGRQSMFLNSLPMFSDNKTALGHGFWDVFHIGGELYQGVLHYW